MRPAKKRKKKKKEKKKNVLDRGQMRPALSDRVWGKGVGDTQNCAGNHPTTQ